MRRLERWAGCLFLLAAAAHGFLTPAHFEEGTEYGLFFLAASLLQTLWGLALLTEAVNPQDAGASWRPLTTGLYVLGILGNLFALGLYLVTRVWGIPMGPLAGVREEVGPLDIATKLAEAGAVVLLAVLLRRHLRAPDPAPAPSTGP